MKLSRHFSRIEFVCRCGCGMDTVDSELIAVLELIRERFGPVHIISGNRCKEHNKAVGGADDSQHLYSKAADILSKGHKPKEVVEWLDKQFPDTYGIGEYDTWVHVDVRKERGRW